MESKKNEEKGYKLLESSKSGDLEMVKFLTEKEKFDINFVDKDGYTALHRAAINGNINICEYLVIQGASINAQTHPEYLRTPLFCSVSYGHVDIAKLLIQKGCRTNITLRNENLLDVAISTNKPDLIGLILENGYSVDYYNPRGIPHLSWALRLAKYDSVAFLLEKGANYRKCCIKYNRSPLHYSVHGDNSEEKGTELVKLLLNHVEKQEGKIKTIEYINYNGGTNGRTVLHHACYMRNYSSVRFLLQYGADRNLKDKEGNKPYDLLYESDHTNVCKQIRALFDSDKQQQHSR